MIVKFNQVHELAFVHIIESMWKDRSTYNEMSYEYLDRYWYEDKWNNDGYIFFVSDDKYGRLTGFILGHITQDKIEILFLFVRPEDRRKNIGSGLKRQVIKYARQLGKKEVFAINLHSNERSLGMNVKIGNALNGLDGIKHFIENIDEFYYRSVYDLKRAEVETYISEEDRDVMPTMIPQDLTEVEDTSELPTELHDKVARMYKNDGITWLCDCSRCIRYREIKDDEDLEEQHSK